MSQKTVRTFLASAGFFILTGLASSVWANAQRILPQADSFSGAWLAGYIANNDNHTDIAINYFRQALKYEPDNQLILPDMMLTLLSAGKFDEAVPLAQQLRDNVNVRRFSRLVLAADAMRRQRYMQAATSFHFQDTEVMDELTATFFSAWADFGAGNRQKAVERLEKSTSGLEWYNLLRLYHLALLHDLAGETQQAATCFQQAIADEKAGTITPDTYERLVISYAIHLLHNKQKQQAIDLLQTSAQKFSGRKTFYELRRQIERSEKPQPLVKNAVEGGAESLYNLGSTINRAGGEAYAYFYLQTARALMPKNDAVYYQLAETSAKAGKPQQAIAFYGKVNRQSPYFYDATIRLALNKNQIGTPEDAIRHLEDLWRQSQDNSQIVSLLASIYMQLEQFDKAAKILGAVLEHSSHNEKDYGNLLFQRAIAYERLQQWDKAEPDFRKALDISPRNPQILNYLGYSLIDRNMKLDEALDMVQKAAYMMPRDGFIVDSLGWAYYKLGRYAEAVNVLEKAVKLRPQDAAINDHLGDAYWRAERKLEATFQWKHAIANKPEAQELAKIQDKLAYGLKDTLPVNGQK